MQIQLRTDIISTVQFLALNLNIRLFGDTMEIIKLRIKSRGKTMIRNILLVSLLTACFINVNAFASNSGKLEPLYGAQFTDKHVIIRVVSSGCTRPEDFSIHAKGKGGTDYSVIAIVRNRPDRCKAVSRLLTVHLELPGALAALKESYRIANLFESNSKFKGVSNK